MVVVARPASIMQASPSAQPIQRVRGTQVPSIVLTHLTFAQRSPLKMRVPCQAASGMAPVASTIVQPSPNKPHVRLKDAFGTT